MVRLKRVYDPPESSDGLRILVDGLWPRGVMKSRAAIAEWMKEIAPSPELRSWFGHRPERWEEFRLRYRKELRAPVRREALSHLREIAGARRLTLLYAARDTDHNNAVVLAELLAPPSIKN